MRNLVKHTPQTLALNLTTEERSIVRASHSELVNDIPILKLADTCIDIISRAYLDAGMTIPGSSADSSALNQAHMAADFAKDLQEYFRGLTIEEVKIAVSRGVRRHYGDFYGINVASLHGFVRSYKHSFDREEALRKQRLHEQATDNSDELTQAQKDERMIDSIEQFFNEYKQSGVITDYGNSKYNFLKLKGCINLTEERKDEIKKIAHGKVTSELETAKLNSFGKAAREITSRIETTFEQRVISEAKRIGLGEFFDFLIETENTPKEYLESLQNETNIDVNLKNNV